MSTRPFAWNFRGRRSVRFQDRDYSLPGDYFVTICTKDRACMFGDVQDGGRMVLNDVGRIVQREWLRSAEVRPNISLGSWIIMPNHLHMIVTIRGDDDSRYITVGSHHEKANATIQTVGATRWVAPNQKDVPPVYQNKITQHNAPHHDEIILSIKDPPVISFGATQRVKIGATQRVKIGATQRVAPTDRPHGPKKGSVGAIIGQFKQATTRLIRLFLDQSSFDVWQRNYWESCLNTEWQYANAEEYIIENPRNRPRDILNNPSSIN